MDFLQDLWKFMMARKKWWLIPTIVVLLLVALLLIFAEGSAFGSFIYTLF